MFNSLILLTVPSVLFYGTCYCETPTNTTTPPSVNKTEALARLNKGNIILSGEFLYQLVSSRPTENVVSSPLSVMIPLAQLAYFSTGTVLKQLLGLLNLKNKDEIMTAFPALIESLETKNDVYLEVATKYFANVYYPLSSNFIEYSKKYFDASTENLNFTKNVEAADIINDWVDNSTHGKIQNLVEPSMFNENTRLVLVNALYFLGNWDHQFNPNNTKIKDFYKSNGDTVQLKIMYQEHVFNYAENDKYQALQIPYKGGEYSFLIVLPKNKDGLLETVESLREPNAFFNLIDSLNPVNVQVHLPKMLMNTQMDFAAMLKQDNITAMFDPNNNDFDGILKKKEPLYVSAAVQKAYISVDETGTEVAAATALILSRMTPPESPTVYIFNANRPYLFYIRSKKMVLFCGAFVK